MYELGLQTVHKTE